MISDGTNTDHFSVYQWDYNQKVGKKTKIASPLLVYHKNVNTRFLALLSQPILQIS